MFVLRDVCGVITERWKPRARARKITSLCLLVGQYARPRMADPHADRIRRCTARPQDESESEGPPLPPHGAPAPPPVMFASPRWPSRTLNSPQMDQHWKWRSLARVAAAAMARGRFEYTVAPCARYQHLAQRLRRLTANERVTAANGTVDETTCTLRHNAWREACDATFRCNSRTYLGTASGFFIGVATVANHLFGRSVRQKIRAAKRAAPRSFRAWWRHRPRKDRIEMATRVLPFYTTSSRSGHGARTAATQR